MCPVCLALSDLYVAGGVSAAAVTTFLAPSCCARDPNRPHRPLPPKQKETTMQRPTIVASSMARAVPSFYNNKKERNNDQSQDRNT